MKKLSKLNRLHVCFNHQFLQGSWNFERMQNGGWCFAILPALKQLFPDNVEYNEAIKRHLEFYNTHPYVSAPILGIVLSMEEARANGEKITDADLHDIKVGLMGPLAGVGDPVFWFTLRPILAAVCASLALSGNILGPILFFALWNIIRFAFLWVTQEMGYKKGISLISDLSDDLLKNVALGASMVGMFVIGILVQQWVRIHISGIQLELNTILPGFVGLIIFFICTKLLKKGMSPVLLIIVLFLICMLLEMAGILVI